MNRTPVHVDLGEYPAEFRSLLQGAAVYDSSCSPQARVWFIDRDAGYFLKASEKGSLHTEAVMTRYFAEKHLSAPVVAYLSEQRDWLLTARVPGEDCIHPDYLAHPERLCDTLAELLRRLHETDAAGCPVTDRNARYLATVEENYRRDVFDGSYRMPDTCAANPEAAYAYVQANKHLLKVDALLHGDYCLPNILLKDFRFSGFIDLGNGGIGDRHIDLFWGAWTLNYNLKTERYRDRFFDAYGRRDIDPEKLRLVSVMECFG